MIHILFFICSPCTITDSFDSTRGVFFNENPILDHSISQTNQSLKKMCECSSKIGSCSYYLCIESKKNCGLGGYFLSYGSIMCNRFYEIRELLSINGTKWMKSVMRCLQISIHNNIINSQVSCKDIETIAFNSHKNCFTKADHNICLLSDKDWSYILQIASYVLVRKPQLGFPQLLEVLKICFEQLPIKTVLLKGVQAIIRAIVML